MDAIENFKRKAIFFQARDLQLVPNDSKFCALSRGKISEQSNKYFFAIYKILKNFGWVNFAPPPPWALPLPYNSKIYI